MTFLWLSWYWLLELCNMNVEWGKIIVQYVRHALYIPVPHRSAKHTRGISDNRYESTAVWSFLFYLINHLWHSIWSIPHPYCAWTRWNNREVVMTATLYWIVTFWHLLRKQKEDKPISVFKHDSTFLCHLRLYWVWTLRFFARLFIIAVKT